MFSSVLRLALVFFALSFCLPATSEAAKLPVFGRMLPTVRAKVKGKHYVHRPNYRRFRAYRQY